MAREIKFRVWDVFNGEFLPEPKHFEINIGTGRIARKGSAGYMGGDFIIEQFTGLLDKNGKEIYENDRVILRNAFKAIGESKDVVAIVKFVYGGFYFWNDEGCCEESGAKPMSWEIIGNIHEESDGHNKR